MVNCVLHVLKVTLRTLRQDSATRLESAKIKVEMLTVLDMVFVSKLVRLPSVFVMLASLMMDINNAEDVLIIYSNSLTASQEILIFSNRM